jgi:hypothetical protein
MSCSDNSTAELHASVINYNHADDDILGDGGGGLQLLQGAHVSGAGAKDSLR